MRTVLRMSIILCCLALSLMPYGSSLPAHAAEAVYTATNSTFGQTDGGASPLSRPVTIGAGPDEKVSDVKIDITFMKGEALNTCSIIGGDSRDAEINFRLTSPSGTKVWLVGNLGPGIHFSNGAGSAGTVTMTFSDSGAPFPAHPANGIFQPAGTARLSAFNGNTAGGTWSLYLFDSVGGQPLCFYSYTLTVTTSTDPVPTDPSAPMPPGPDMIPIPADAAMGTFVTDSPLYYAPDPIAVSDYGMKAGQSLWVFGLSEKGDFYQVVLAGQKLWVPVSVLDATAAGYWNGQPLPTNTVN